MFLEQKITAVSVVSATIKSFIYDVKLKQDTDSRRNLSLDYYSKIFYNLQYARLTEVFTDMNPQDSFV